LENKKDRALELSVFGESLILGWENICREFKQIITPINLDMWRKGNSNQ